MTAPTSRFGWFVLEGFRTPDHYGDICSGPYATREEAEAHAHPEAIIWESRET